MNKITIICVALLASAAFGEPSGPYMSYLGYGVGNGGTGEYSNYIGAYSGQYSTGISRCGFYGPASGQYGYNLYGCNGVGFYALANSEYMTNVFAVGTSAGRGASNCKDCIFIGNDAGRGSTNRVRAIDIGGVFKYMGDVEGNFNPFNIYFGDTRISDLFITSDVEDGFMMKNYSGEFKPVFSSGFFVRKNNRGIGCFYGDSVISDIGGMYYFPYSENYGRNRKFSFATLKDCDDIKTSVFQSITIEDEDTGEEYIIKVKSGALKLYKVEETEE